MGQVVRDIAYRARGEGRQSRLGWLLLIGAFNLVLWSGLIALVARAS